MTDLLDAPVLAALVIAEHEHHDRAGRWLAGVDSFAICPFTEAALVRFLLRLGESPTTALAVTVGIRSHPKCRFVSADLSVAKLDGARLGAADHLDQAYLAALAAANGGRLATLDEAAVERVGASSVLIPA